MILKEAAFPSLDDELIKMISIMRAKKFLSAVRLGSSGSAVIVRGKEEFPISPETILALWKTYSKKKKNQ